MTHAHPTESTSSAWNIFDALCRANPRIGRQVKAHGHRTTVLVIFESMMRNAEIPNFGAAELAWDLTVELHDIALPRR